MNNSLNTICTKFQSRATKKVNDSNGTCIRSTNKKIKSAWADFEAIPVAKFASRELFHDQEDGTMMALYVSVHRQIQFQAKITNILPPVL